MPVRFRPARCGTLPLLSSRLNHLQLVPNAYSQIAVARRYSSSTAGTISKSDASIDKVSSDTHISDSENASSARPLRRLSTPDVYRTMMLSQIFASPALSRFCLGALGWIANSRQPFLDPDRNRALNHLLRIFIYNQFCAGTKPAEITHAVRCVKSRGFAGVILGYAREIVAHGLAESDPTVDISAKQVEEWLEGNLATLGCIDEGDYLSIKYTGAGGAIASALTADAEPPKQFAEALEKLCIAARNKGARIMVDAEQQIYQPTIDRWTVDIMRKHNRGDAVVLNTYQAYLKGTRGVIREHLELAQQEGWTFGIKLVRGAYILNEIRDRIHDTKADTDANYNGIVHDLLSRSFDGLSSAKGTFPRTSIFLAGHNGESIHRALAVHKKLSAAGGAARPDSLELGQLYGMADHVSGELVSEVEKAYGPADRLGRSWGELKESPAPRVFKAMCWGSVREVLHFLMRRAAENQGAAQRLQDGLSVSWRELRHRWFGLRS